MTSKKAAKKAGKKASAAPPNYPRQSPEKALRIPRAILEQNAGKECSDSEAVGYLGLKLSGALQVEISSGVKFGFLERPSAGQLRVTERAKRALRPQSPRDGIDSLREAVLDAPVIADVYKHYRGENLPDQQFFDNALTDTFKIPHASLSEFKAIFIESLKAAELLGEHGGKSRVLDVSGQGLGGQDADETLKKLGRAVNITTADTCFVVMPFAEPLGSHYSLIYEPAIKKAGLKPVPSVDTQIRPPVDT